MTLREAFMLVKKSRPLIGPHFHLRKQLVLFERTYRKESTLAKGDDWIQAEDTALAHHTVKPRTYPVKMKSNDDL